jgi:hypothetical protein
MEKPQSREHQKGATSKEIDLALVINMQGQLQHPAHLVRHANIELQKVVTVVCWHQGKGKASLSLVLTPHPCLGVSEDQGTHTVVMGNQGAAGLSTM